MHNILRVVLLFLLMHGAAAAQDSPESTPEAAPERVGAAWLHFANVAEDAPSASLLLDAEIVMQAVPFGSISPYIAVPADETEVSIALADGTLLATQTVPFQAGHTYLTAAAGSVAGGNLELVVLDETTLMETRLQENPQMGDPAGLARFLMVHAIHDGPPVAMVLQTGENVFNGLPFGSFYASPVQPGIFPLLVLNAADSSVLFTQLNPLEMSAGIFYVVILGGSGDSPQMLVTSVGTRSVGDMLALDPQWSTFYEALNATGVLETLQSSGPLTVFAPTNDAFAAMDAAALAALDEDALTRLLLNHIVVGDVRPQSLAATAEMTTAAGTTLTLSSDDGFVISGVVTFQPTGYLGINGTVYYTDGVILPAE